VRDKEVASLSWWRMEREESFLFTTERAEAMLKIKHAAVYYESIKGELKKRGIYECQCDERLPTKTKEFTRLRYTGLKNICFSVRNVQRIAVNVSFCVSIWISFLVTFGFRF